MAFNDHQYFYAALYCAACLPGGENHTAAICKRHFKPSIPIDAPKSEHQGIKPVTLPQFTVFFNTLYNELRAGHEELHKTDDRKSTYMKLCRKIRSNPNSPMSDSIEKAVEKAGLGRGQLPASLVYLHDNGQILTNTNGGALIDLDYPERPALDLLGGPMMRYEDIQTQPRMVFETIARVVPLTEGQTYPWVYISVGGNRNVVGCEADRDQALIVTHSDVSDIALLQTLTDDEILKGDDRVNGCFADDRNLYVAGYADDNGYYAAATAHPHIVRTITAPFPAWTVTRPVQIGMGSSFKIAQAGDVVYAQVPKEFARIVRKEDLDSNRVRLKLAALMPRKPASAPKP